MNTYEITFHSDKKYDLQIDRTTIIKAKDVLSCERIFKKNFKNCKVVNVKNLTRIAEEKLDSNTNSEVTDVLSENVEVN